MQANIPFPVKNLGREGGREGGGGGGRGGCGRQSDWLVLQVDDREGGREGGRVGWRDVP